MSETTQHNFVRQRDEQIVIEVPVGDQVEPITVTVVDICDDKVCLGIDGNLTEIPVHRKEVFDAIRRENEKQQQ